jgi:hypothetical protein
MAKRTISAKLRNRGMNTFSSHEIFKCFKHKFYLISLASWRSGTCVSFGPQAWLTLEPLL